MGRVEDEFDVVRDLQAKFARLERPLVFKGTDFEDWLEWRRKLFAKLVELMAPWPERCPLQVRAESETIACEGYSAQRISYYVESNLRATAWVLKPDRPRSLPDGKSPGVVALHGHGSSASHGPAGNPFQLEELGEEIASLNYAYGAQLARCGYYVVAPDARGWGERIPLFKGTWPGCDGCNVAHLMAQLSGWCLQTLHTWDDMRAVDVLADLPEVASDHIAAVGLSFGGTRTLYLAILDERIRAAVIAGYLTLFAVYAMGRQNFCGSQFVPQIGAWCELPDLFGLIAPKPLLCQSGERDVGFPIEAARAAAEQVRHIYTAAGVPERFRHYVFGGGHEFDNESALEFLEEVL